MLEGVQYNTLWLAHSWGQADFPILYPWALQAMFPFAWPPAKIQAENINISHIVCYLPRIVPEKYGP